MDIERTSSAGDLEDAEVPELVQELERLRRENQRLELLLGLSGPRPLLEEQARRPLFRGVPGAVNASSLQSDKVLFFRNLFAGRDDVHAVRWENERTGRSGWIPAVEGGFRRDRQNRSYLPLTDEAITAHLTGTIHAGIYPLMSDDRCRLLAALVAHHTPTIPLRQAPTRQAWAPVGPDGVPWGLAHPGSLDTG